MTDQLLKEEKTKGEQLEKVIKENETYYKITNSDAMRPFFMSIVSDSNHWMFISSNGGLTAGRKNAEYALFPYYTDDKITESADITGSKSIFWVEKEGEKYSWEPFSERFSGKYKITRNLYKNAYGNKILFEEINHSLDLTFTYQWNSTNTFGFVKKSKLINHSQQDVEILVLDGLQNIIPSGVGSDLQNRASNLVDAYKRSELDKSSGLGVFALSAIIVDKAEPSEALKANVVWSIGLENPTYLLSSRQLNDYRKGKKLQEETDIKAEKGAYFVHEKINLKPNAEKEWMFVADVNKNHSDVAALTERIKKDTTLYNTVNQKIEGGTQRLIMLNASADALQSTADDLRDTRHFSNTLFNIMRGGIFDYNYQIEKWDFSEYLKKANRTVYQKVQKELELLPEKFTLTQLKELTYKHEDANFSRLSMEYLPLRFSRRHGDPSRPWNKFSINTHSEDGAKILDYEGNWRDIFQNWEALALSFPEFMENMMCKFLNASTFDGYNPYRVTKDGFDWETIEPDDPWSYIGYWGDHQIIYLLKFLEFLEKHKPGKLEEYFDKEFFVYANVPYKIKPYQDIVKNSKDTIDFDLELDEKIRELRSEIGADGALLRDENDEVVQVNFIEKIIATTLAKISNFIPEGGIWMNTQRPEWNDANNALVGNGVSMVTLYYLRRFLQFFKEILSKTDLEGVKVSNEVVDFYKQVRQILEDNQHLLEGNINDEDRKMILDGLGKAASEFREHVYEQAFWGKKRTISFDGLRRFVDVGLAFIEHSIRANQREDKMFHAYNLMTIENEKEVSISYLDEMLEGQVAVLSSGYLKPEEALAVLDGMKNSALFRHDQYSYLLYPNKNIKGFFDRNNIPEAMVEKSSLLKKLIEEENTQIIERSIKGTYHFNGNFKNSNDVKEALGQLSTSAYAEWVTKDHDLILTIFEEVFNHKAFTGRSGTFFGYEGLGSIYWHMVSKLQLAVQECCLDAIEKGASAEIIGRLLEHYYEINEGIGVHKSPALYGAFPTDPYSHTPAGKGAQQPGMTGQVKEDVLSRFGELGVVVKEGVILFNPTLLKKSEFLTEATVFHYTDIALQQHEIALEKDTLAFTYCQVPVIYKRSNQEKIMIMSNDGTEKRFDGIALDQTTSENIFNRSGVVKQVMVHINPEKLK